jgi:AP-1-like transcription factor
LDGGSDSMSMISPTSSRSSPERRMSSNYNIVAQVQKSIPDKIERRREQNRSSQRAYRERKDKHQKELEQQISDWRDKHQKLAQNYDQQTQEVQRLQQQIEQLSAEIGSLQNGLPTLSGIMEQSPTEFDLVPWFDHGSAAPSPRSSSR